MANLNRIKVVLVEKIKLANGSQTSWANRHAQLVYINSNNMANLNRIKVVLVEKIKLANGSQTSWANRHAQLVNGAKTQYNRI